MAVRKPEMILIDVDGTLVDSVPDLSYCVNAMLRQLGLPERDETKVRDWVGNGVERLVQRGLVGALDGRPDAELYRRALPVFMELYSENISQRSHLYPGVLEGLSYIKGTGISLGSVTNKAARFTEPLLQDLGIYEDFSLVVSGDTLAKKKPDPAPLLYAAEHFQVEPAQALMVGDSVNDVNAARAAGFQIVCVSYGYNHGQDIRDARPDAVIDSLAEIRTILEQAA